MLPTILFVMTVAVLATVITQFFINGGKTLFYPHYWVISAVPAGLIAWALCAIAVVGQTSDYEYWTGYVTKVTYTEGWTEYRTVVTTDSKGNIQTHIETITHWPEWSVYDTNGQCSGTGEKTYLSICGRFGVTKPATGGWSGRTYQYQCDWNPSHMYVWTTVHHFRNPVLIGNSIFNYRDFTKAEVESLRFPRWKDLQWCSAWRGQAEHLEVIDRINADLGKSNKVRVHLLFVPEGATEEWPHQLEEYWRGGKKNELTIVVRVDGEWNVWDCHTFGWSNCEAIKAYVREHISSMGRFDIHSLDKVLREQLAGWEPARYKEFEHVRVRIPSWVNIVLAIFTALVVTAITSAGLQESLTQKVKEVVNGR